MDFRLNNFSANVALMLQLNCNGLMFFITFHCEHRSSFIIPCNEYFVFKIIPN